VSVSALEMCSDSLASLDRIVAALKANMFLNRANSATWRLAAAIFVERISTMSGTRYAMNVVYKMS